MCMRYEVQIGERYGVMKGGRKLVFIKTGRGSSIYGYQNKYLRLADDIREKTGCSVVVSANLPDLPCDLLKEIGEISAVTERPDAILFVGVSNGALIGAQQGWTVEKLRAMLLINGPLTINWHKTKAGLERFRGDRVELIYGSRDPSFPYVGMLDRIASDVCSYRILEGVGHDLADGTDLFHRTVMRFIEEVS